MTVSPKPNLQLVYVSDIERSVAFYKTIFNADPVFSSPRYVTFAADDSGKALFTVWTGGTTPEIATPRFSEIGILLPSNEDVDRLFEKWEKNDNINIVKKPYNEVFGRTFLVKDPDGHIIRVSPVDLDQVDFVATVATSLQDIGTLAVHMIKQPIVTTARRLLRPFAISDAPVVQMLAGSREIASTTTS